MANEVHVRVNERGKHQPYRRINGLYALDVGPAFVSPRDAITYATELEATPSVSPLRASAESSSAPSVSPDRVAVSSDDSAEPPRDGLSGLGGQSQ